LLSLDMLMKNKKFDEAEKEAIKSLSLCSSDDLKNSYLSRLIEIYHQQEKYDLALEQADITIEMDEYSIKNNLRKLSLLRDSNSKMEFITLLLEKFKYSYEIKNQFVIESLNHRLSKNFKNDVSLDNLMKKLESSLIINPSLENRAWDLTQKTLEAIKNTNDNNKEYKEELNKLVEEMNKRNPTHLHTLEMRMNACIQDVDIEKAIDLLKELGDFYKTSSNKKKEGLFELMININRKLTSFRNREKALECAKELLENYNDKFEKTESALPHLFKAEYYISYDRDLKMAKDSVLKAIEYDDVCDWAQPCLDILLYGQADFDNGIKLLEKCKPELKESKYYLMLSQINVERGDFEEANKAIDKALSSSLNYDDYLINKSFIYLHEDANQKVLNLLSREISELAPGTGKEALVINRELANKRSTSKTNRIDLQNVIGRDKKGPASVAAHILLDEEVPARRLLDEIINNDFSYYYIFMRWPVIPNKYLEKYQTTCVAGDKLSA
ncbi:TPA: hypothetical protein NPN84_004663, partial [Klebsiella variicola subsp. variicola]|nr:hypothetical protein [Klebsiella variicola subsp. variicola]